MNPLDEGSSSSAPSVENDLVEKRKRRRPRKEKSQETDVDLVGQTVYCEVERSIDKEGTGYLVNVNVKDSDTKLNGVVFVEGKVIPVTPENDVAPHVKMYTRVELNNQTGHPQPDQTPNDQPTTDDVTDLEISESSGANSLVIHQSKGVEEEEAASSSQ